MYGGLAYCTFIESMINLTSFLGVNKIQFNYEFVYNESLITRGRNTLVDKFLKSDCDVILFIDADIGFNWHSVIEMLELMATDEDKKILCATYPKKSINWDNINKAYKNNFINESTDAIKYSSSFVLNYSANESENVIFDLSKPVKVRESGTGFMMIHREVFNKFKKNYPDQMSFNPETKTDIFYYFDCKIDPETKIYLSEDYMFCQYAGKIGYDTWILPWINLCHTGSYMFQGSFSEDAKMYHIINDLPAEPTVEK